MIRFATTVGNYDYGFDLYQTKGDWLNQKWTELIAS